MDAPQLQQQVIPASALRLPDMRLQAGPREIEFEIELPKGAQWDLSGENKIEVTSSAPQILAPGEGRLHDQAMRFMIPATALHSGETVLTYNLSLAWVERTGSRCTDQRQVVQRVLVESARGATVPWVHYKAQANGEGPGSIGKDRRPDHVGDGEHA